MRHAAAVLALIVAIPVFGDARTEKRRLIAELLDVLDARTLVHASFDTMLATLRRSVDESQEMRLEDLPAEYREAWELERKREEALANRFRDGVFRQLDAVRYADNVYVPLFDDRFTSDELRELIAFFRTKTGQKLAGVIPHVADGGVAGRDLLTKAVREAGEEMEKEEIAASPWKSTMADMRTIATALEARATDTNEYPKGMFEDLEALLAPTYIVEVPKVDAWGTPFVYVASADGMHYRVVSAGADRTFEWSSRQVDLTATEPVVSPNEDEDIIFQDGMFIQFPLQSMEAHQ